MRGFVAACAAWALLGMIAGAAWTSRAAWGDTVEEKFDGGARKAIYNEINGIRVGPFTEFFENGKPRVKGSYKAGKLHGGYQEFHENGKPALRAKYADDKFDGRKDEFDDQGRLICSTGYRSDVLSGQLNEFRPGEKTAFRQEYWIDGTLAFPRSISQIQAELKRIETIPVEVVGEAPAIDYPGVKEALADPKLLKDSIDGVHWLMQWRYLSGVPYEPMSLDRVGIAHAVAGADLIVRNGAADHHPPKPAGMDQKLYDFAHEGTARSNLHNWSSGSSPVESIRFYMQDSDEKNISAVGHRRWCLNPKMGKLGFGVNGRYSCMWAHDGSRKETPDFDFIAFPANGWTPGKWLSAKHAWSISLNREKYSRPADKDLEITVTPTQISSRDASVRFGQPLTFNYRGVASSDYGPGPTVIFRPEGAAFQPGTTYCVQIKGLTAKGDAPTTIRYYVGFF
jgi:hypothetical protein